MSNLKNKLSQLEDLAQEIAQEAYNEKKQLEEEKEELEHKLSESINPQNLATELKLVILKRFANQLSLEQLEHVENLIGKLPQFNNYNCYL